jgi:hypothetical protein
MRQSLKIFILILFVSGCRSSFTTDPFAYLDDPVARAVGARWYWEPHTHFDAGVILIRSRTSNFVRDAGTTDIRMAFDVNNNPVKVDGAEVNGILLPWIASEHGLFHAQIFAKDNNSTGFGAADSATFRCAGFDGEDLTTTVEVAPDFGDITIPDTIVTSQELKIQYAKAVPGDSIRVTIFGILRSDSLSFNKMLPDTGAIIIPSAMLPPVQSNDTYIIQVSRFHFTQRVSPKGKIIGIYSVVEFPNFGYPVKP